MFDRICHRYDLLNHLLSFGMDFYWRKRAVKELGLLRGNTVIDLCCGTGDLAYELWKAVRPGKVVGVDFAPAMLEVARRKYPYIVYVEGNVMEVPWESGTFDAATIAFGPRNISDLPGLFAEMKRLVRPGGKVLSLELTRPSGWLGFFHSLYLRYVLPWVGGWLSGDVKAYRYLSETVSGFIEPNDLAEIMEAAGLCRVEVIPLSAGIVTLHIATVP